MAVRAYYNEIDPKAASWLRELIKEKLIADGEVDERSIIDVGPGELKGFTQHHFFAGIGGWSYALRLAGWPDDKPVWTGSCPCFPAGTLVMTDSGMIPIESIKSGDQVLTHKARWRTVTLAWSKGVEKCVEVKGQGHHGLICTPNHPFLVKGGEWIEASELHKEKWSSITAFPSIPIPKISHVSKGYSFDKSIGKFRVRGEKNGKGVYLGIVDSVTGANELRAKAIKNNLIDVRGANGIDVDSLGFARFLGYWLGDGWTSGETVILCGSLNDRCLLDEIMKGAGLKATHSSERTSSRVRCGSQGLVIWLNENFGKGASGKKIPAWVHGSSKKYRDSFLRGYWEADEHDESQKNGETVRRFTTVSKSIAIGVRILLNQSGMSASITKHQAKRKNIIEGRNVSEKPFYRVTSYVRSRSFEFGELHGYGYVRSIKGAGEYRVYNIAVEEDESYTADGIIVHNCQPFSAAGKNKGKSDDRHLWPHFFRLIRECKPNTVFGEQVEGAIKHGWLDDLQTDLEGEGYAVGHCVLGAHSVGSPHIRKRLYWVGHSKYKGYFANTLGRKVATSQVKSGVQQFERSSACDDWMANSSGTGHKKQPGITRVSCKKNCDDSGKNSVGSSGVGDMQSERCGETGTSVGRSEEWVAGSSIRMGDAQSNDEQWDRQSRESHKQQKQNRGSGVFNEVEWIYCRDGKYRPIKPGIKPLVNGLPRGVVYSGDSSIAPNETQEARVMRLKGYGNAIVPQVAAEFIRAFK